MMSIDWPIDYVLTLIDLFLLDGTPAILMGCLGTLKFLSPKLLKCKA